jgi:hypothetical protein
MDLEVQKMLNQSDALEAKAKALRIKAFKYLHQNRELPKVLNQEIGKEWVAYHGDAVEVVGGIPSDSIHYTIFSPPFSNLFVYSASLRDMGNSSDSQFCDHFEYLVPEMLRVTVPGRLVTMHCSDIPAMKERDGYIGLKDFPGYLRQVMEKHGWIFYSRHIIWKDPLLEAVRTKALGLAHKQLVKDSSRCRAGLPDMLMTFVKPGDNPYPIEHGRGFEEYTGELAEPRYPKNNDPGKNKYSHTVWQRYASPVWMDINQSQTLNAALAREKNDERHICPLQLQVIERCLELWSAKGETIASWFAGIGSEGYVAVQKGRKAVLVELKESYYNLLVKHMRACTSAKLGKFKL